MTEPIEEIVQDELGVMTGGATVVTDLLGEHEGGRGVQARGPLGEVHVEQAVDSGAVAEFLVLVEDEEVRESARGGVLHDLLDGPLDRPNLCDSRRWG